MHTISELQRAREAYQPKLPPVFREGGAHVTVVTAESIPPADAARIQGLFPHTYSETALIFGPVAARASAPAITVGVILSGGQAPGGHNVIAGLFDGLKSLNPANRLIGFLGGPGGLIDNRYIELDARYIQPYRNTGGFDIIGSGRTKIETPAQIATAIANCGKLGIQGLVIIGGDDSNTNAAVLAEAAKAAGAALQVVGCPKTIDGDLKNAYIETSFGFDTACKVYSELIGNIERDALSARKYWHFVKLMGRSASHIALECALQTHANVTIISEEVAARARTLAEIVDELAAVVTARAANKMDFGVALIPEGLIEFIPEMKHLIHELNEILAHGQVTPDQLLACADAGALVHQGLSAAAAATFAALPTDIREQLLMDRDPHGNVQVAKIETERLLIELVQIRLGAAKAAGSYKGKFSAQAHYLGYEGRCAQPTNFDADYCYSLGYGAAALLGAGLTGYISSIRHLTRGADHWVAGGIPITAMMNIERRHGEDKPVIKKALVELDGAPFRNFADHRAEWATENRYVYPGPIQYFGPSEVCDQPTVTLILESQA